MIRRPPRSTLLSLHDALPILDAKQVVALCVGRPELARGVPGDRDGLRATLGYGHRVALVERVALSRGIVRSEEHTSELQSRQYLVCRLLLEKKNKYRLQIEEE